MRFRLMSIDIFMDVLYTSAYRGAEIRFRRSEFNRSFCKPTTDVISILTANQIAKAWASFKEVMNFRAPVLATVTA